MKVTMFPLLMTILFLPISLGIDINQRVQIKAQEYKQIYNEIMYVASEDATMSLLDQGSISKSVDFDEAYKHSKNLQLNINQAVERFYETVYMNLGIKDDKVAQDALKIHLPVQMVVGYDGLYIHTWENVYNTETSSFEVKEIWLPKFFYSYYDSEFGLIVNFTLDDYVYVYNSTAGAWEEGSRADMYSKYPGTLFANVNFDNIRRQNIITLIQDRLEFYTARYNSIAQNYGKGYMFNVPMIDNDTWNNTINDVCFISFLQGLVIPGTDESYSTYGFGGTRLSLKNKIYGNVIDGVQYYHSKECSQLAVIDDTFNSRKEAAQKGYRQCPYCKP